MTQYKDSAKAKLIRLFWVVMGQLMWMVPLFGIGYYVREHLGEWVDMYFNVEHAQKTAKTLSARADRLSEPVIMNPSAVIAYVKATFAAMTASTKAYSLSSISGILSGVGVVLLNIGGIVAGIYGLIRIRRSYRAEKHDADLTNRICREIMPELEKIRAEIKTLKK